MSPFERPLGVLGSLGAAFRVYFSNANTLFVIVAIFMIPATILSTLLIRATIPDELLTFDPTSGGNPFAGFSLDDFRSFIAAAVFSGVLMFVVAMVAIGACFRAIHESLHGQRPNWRTSIAAGLAKTKSLVWLPVLMGLLFIGVGIVGVVVIGLLGAIQDGLAAIGILALFVAFVYGFVVWSLAIPVLMAEDERGSKALARSRELVRGNWWPTFGIYLLAFLAMIVISAILGAMFNTRGRVGDEGLVLSTLASIVSNIIFTPFQAALVGVVYLDLRARSATGQTPGTPDGPPLPPPAALG